MNLPTEIRVCKALAYCGYLHAGGISLPGSGVAGAPLQTLAFGNLRVLWSQVEWPFAAPVLQQSAIEFHSVVDHIFQQTAVAPFPLLTVFAGRESLAAFSARNEKAIVADLERLQDCVQMECVLYVIGTRSPLAAGPGDRRTQYDADALRRLAEYADQVTAAAKALGRETRVRAETASRRIFALMERGQEQRFQQMLQDLPLPELVSRRYKGPRPAAEFLSVRLAAPQPTAQP